MAQSRHTEEDLFSEVPDPTEGDVPIASSPTWKLTPRGYAMDEAVSALQKAIRRARPLEAIYWGHELWEKYPAYFWRRMMIIVSEDCAATPDAAVTVGQLAMNAQLASKNFAKGQCGGIIEAQAILVACRAPKSKEALDAVSLVREAKVRGLRIEPPDYAVDLHTSRGKRMGRDIQHFIEHGRLIAGELGQNDYEIARWGEKQPYLGEPGEDGQPPDIDSLITDAMKPYAKKD